jgi:hypothetical protein
VRAVEWLAELMESPDERVATVACQAVLDRAFGRPRPTADKEPSLGDRLAAMSPQERRARLAELTERHCQLNRPWYARRVGGAAVRVRELLCSPIVLPRSSRAGGKKAAWVRKLTMPRHRLPALHLSRVEIDNTFVNPPVLASDNDRPTHDSLPWPPCKHPGFVGLRHVDQRKPGCRIDSPGAPQRIHGIRDLGGGQRIQRMRHGSDVA